VSRTGRWPSGRHNAGMNARVLIADDDRAIRESLSRALELAGYDVVLAADGVRALAAAHRAAARSR
jgi:two-component system, OmpR family, response regulator MprA